MFMDCTDTDRVLRICSAPCSDDHVDAAQPCWTTIRGRAGRDLQDARRRHPRAHPRRASRAPSCCVCDIADAARAERVGGLPSAAAAARPAAGPAAPRGPADLLRPRRPAHRPPVRAGPRARAGERRRHGCGADRQWSRHERATCTVCELHAESTFTVEGMDCREEVALIERRFKNLPGLEDFSADLMRPAPAREVRRGQAVGLDDHRRGRRRRHARLARARGADRRPADPRAGARPARVLVGIGRAVRRRVCSPTSLARRLARRRLLFRRRRSPLGVPTHGAQGVAVAAPAIARHQRPDAGRGRRRDGARPVVRSRGGRVPVRHRAGARGADARARAPRRPRVDGTDAVGSAGPRRSRRADACRSNRSRRARSSS